VFALEPKLGSFLSSMRYMYKPNLALHSWWNTPEDPVDWRLRLLDSMDQCKSKPLSRM